VATLGTTNLDVISASRVPDRRSRRCEPCDSSDRTGGAARVTPRLACPLRWPLRARRTIRAGASGRQRPYPRTSSRVPAIRPPICKACGRNVDDGVALMCYGPTCGSFGRPAPEPTEDARLETAFGRPLPETRAEIRRRDLPPSVRSPNARTGSRLLGSVADQRTEDARGFRSVDAARLPLGPAGGPSKVNR
jgi:hypothetical protein